MWWWWDWKTFAVPMVYIVSSNSQHVIKRLQLASLMVSLAKWLSIRVQTKWVWVWVQLLSHNLQILRWYLLKCKQPKMTWNDLKLLETTYNEQETTFNEQEATWNNLQQARNELKQPTASKKQPKITWNNLEWARNNILFTYFLNRFQTFDIFYGCCL